MTTAATTTTQPVEANSPGPAVRAFLDAYAAREPDRACQFVSSSFTRPGGRSLRPPASCTASGTDPNDALAQPMTITVTDPREPVARVLAENAKRTQFLFRLQRHGSGWQITNVVRAGRRAANAKPKMPAAK